MEAKVKVGGTVLATVEEACVNVSVEAKAGVEVIATVKEAEV